MAKIIRQRTVTIPANTSMNSLYRANLNLPVETIESVDIRVPSGAFGLMGFYIAVSDQQIIPFEPGQFFVWNDDTERWPIEDYPNAGGWQVFGYNLDSVYPHRVELRFHDVPIDTPLVQVPTLTFISSPELVSDVLL